VGSPCAADDVEACDFSASGESGFCHEFAAAAGFDAGICSLRCAGLCPDRGNTTTFCVELTEDEGSCVPRSSGFNDHCADIPGTRAVEVDRFVGDSGVAVTRAVVCLPDEIDTETETEPQPEPEDAASCMGWCGRDEAAPGSAEAPCYCDEQCGQLGDCCADHADVCT
jgi:hypothetical protein